MDLTAKFEQAVARSKELTKRPSNEELLKLYGLYKQATEGDATGERPGGFDFKAIAKYDAWAEMKGTSREKAQEAYIALVDQLHKQYA
jgi:acyl-CoA-binding protein